MLIGERVSFFFSSVLQTEVHAESECLQSALNTSAFQ